MPLKTAVGGAPVVWMCSPISWPIQGSCEESLFPFTRGGLIMRLRAKSGGKVELSSWPMLCGLWVGRVFVAGRLPIRAVGSVGVF